MKNYGLTYSKTEPLSTEITKNSVFIATNIEQYSRIGDNGEQDSGYKYNLTEYTKDEYIAVLAQNNARIEEELTAAKILLGVE